MNQHIVFDTEIIGKAKPVFLLRAKIIETQERFGFWFKDLKRAIPLFERPKLTWIGFNSYKFDLPLIAAWINGKDIHAIKELATQIVEHRLMPWDAMALAGCGGMALDIDHIDLFEVAPGPMTSLKTYAGRMHYPSIIDLPFHHDKDLTPKECKILDTYCDNDLGVTEMLFLQLKEQRELRHLMSEEHQLDLRSKSDAQIAEAIMKKMTKVYKRISAPLCDFVTYKTPAIIKTKNPVLKTLINRVNKQKFELVKDSPVLPDWMANNFVKLNQGEYAFGLGGLHSKHDKCVYHEASNNYWISDFDVTSYYPNIILKLGLIPQMAAGKGEAFIEAYRRLYDQRIAALKTGNTIAANSLKISLNGLFGKLGSKYCAFYSPDLLLAVTITGQLNLLCIIEALSKHRSIGVLSANTDGVTIGYPPNMRTKVTEAIEENAKRTGFEYKETRYSKLAMKDVNNYIAIKLDGKVKTKGLYADEGLMKNPTMPICSHAAVAYLKDGTPPEKFIRKEKKLEPFLSIRNVKGGCIQHQKIKFVDDWYETDEGWKAEDDDTIPLQKRKSRPAPRPVEYGGTLLGRVARWYYTTTTLPPLRYVINGNMVPKTEGARECLRLPEKFPQDLDYQRYIDETYQILRDIGLFESTIAQKK